MTENRTIDQAIEPRVWDLENPDITATEYLTGLLTGRWTSDAAELATETKAQLLARCLARPDCYRHGIRSFSKRQLVNVAQGLTPNGDPR